MTENNGSDDLNDPLDASLGYQLRRASLTYLSHLTGALEALNLTPTEGVVLLFVAANAGCNQAQISRALGVKRTNMVPIIGRLVDVGLITRRMANGRTHALSVSEAGLVARQAVMDVRTRLNDKYFGEFDEATKTVLLSAFKRIQGFRS